MDIVIEQINSVGKAFVEFAWPMLWQASVLIAVLLAADWLMRRKVRAVFRYWLWMLVLVKLFLPTTLSSPVSIGMLGNALPAINIAATERPVGGDTLNTLPYLPRTAETGEASGASHTETPIQSQAVTPVVSLTRDGGIFLVWLMVVCAMLLLLMQRAIFVRGLVRQSAEATGLMNDALKFCCNLMGVGQTIRLKISPNATSPAVCGLFRPVILVPQGLGPSLGINSLRVVLMHELAHIKRGDLWVNLVQTVLQIAYFYNPLLWVANWVIRRVREQAVDEAVQVALGEKAQQYPETLLNVARLAFERPALSLRLTGVVESKGALTSRIKRMLTRPVPKTAKLGILGMAVILIFAAILLPMARASQKSAVDNAFRKQLPNGVTVELVGVCDYPSKGRQWWRPDGSPLGFDIETQDTSNYTDKNKAYEIAYKVEAPNDVSVGWPKIQGSTSQSGLEVNSPSGIQAARTHINVWGNTTKIKFPVAAGEWTTLGQTTGQVQSNTTVGSQKLMFGPAEGTREKLVLTTSDDIKSEDDYRLVAFDKQGNLHTSSKKWFSIKDLRQSTFVFVNLDPAAVDRFEFQTRPYQWVEFKNVSLRPTGKWNWQTGTRTTPDFTIKGIVTDAQTGKPIAGAKVGDAERYAGGKYGAVTDSEGNYSYKTWYEEHDVKCEADGYKTENKILLTKALGSEQEKVLDFAISSKKNGDDGFKAELSNGETVELVAICDYPDGKPRSWRPDGSKLEKQIYIKREGVYQDGKYGFIVKVDIPGMSSNFQVEKIEGVRRLYSFCKVMDSGVEIKGTFNITMENNKPRRKGYLASITEDLDGRETTSVRVKIAAGPWKTRAVYDGRSTAIKDDSGYVFSKAYEEDAGVNIVVSGKWQESEEQGIVAIDTNGGSYIVTNYPMLPGSAQQMTGRFDNMKLSQIKEFRAQTRPYRWVEFRNVSLRPGVKTDVQVEVEGSQSKAGDAQPIIQGAEFGDANGANSGKENRMSKPEKTGPPVVVRTTPETLANDISSDLNNLTVTFNQQMKDKSWAWVQWDAPYPETTGQPYYDNEKKTCSLPVKLKAGQAYLVAFNVEPYIGFVNSEGKPAKSYVLVFATKSKDGKPTPIPEELIVKAKSVNERALSGPEGKESGAESVPYTQIVYDDIRPDGTMFFKNTIREINRSNGEITNKRFINSDFVQVTAMRDANGREIKFNSIHDGDIFRYEVTFNKPIPPGELIEYISEGTMKGLIKPVAGEQGVFQYYMRHSPAADEPTRRVETYLLPAGAELISATPNDMERRTKDGRIEIHVEKMIPPGGSITTSFQYRVP